MAPARWGGQTAAVIVRQGSFHALDVQQEIYPIIFSENIFVAAFDLTFMVLRSGEKMTDTET
ncbi:MAG: hypothetical protein ABI963_11565 [Rhizomicrobium sp.]